MFDEYLIPDLANIVFEWIGKDYFNELLREFSKNGDLNSLKILFVEVPTKFIDVNVCNNFGNTALHYASINGRIKIVEMLLSVGADVNVRGGGRTALHEASIFDYTEIVEMLKKYGAK